MPNPGHKRVIPFNPDETHRRSFPIASAMRDAGFVPLPRLWVKAADMDQIYRITDRYRDEVMEIRQRVLDSPEAVQAPDPVTDKEAAWAAYERQRNAS